MFRPWMVAAATAFALAACDKSPVAPAPNHAATPTASAAIDLIGIVGATGPTQIQPVMLTLDDGSTITLTGEAVRPMRSVIGAQTDVRGIRDGVGDFEVSGFLVLAVGGQPAADGMLQQMADGYALQRADGTYRAVLNPSAALLAHLGQRVWVTGPEDAPPAAFGVIT
jgi:hypothetical protein